jgi:hypothetical protein
MTLQEIPATEGELKTEMGQKETSHSLVVGVK